MYVVSIFIPLLLVCWYFYKHVIGIPIVYGYVRICGTGLELGVRIMLDFVINMGVWYVGEKAWTILLCQIRGKLPVVYQKCRYAIFGLPCSEVKIEFWCEMIWLSNALSFHCFSKFTQDLKYQKMRLFLLDQSFVNGICCTIFIICGY